MLPSLCRYHQQCKKHNQKSKKKGYNRSMLFILFGAFVDGLQALVAWAFLTMGGVFTTATLGVGAGSIPLGIGAGMGVDLCIDATFGVALITALGIFGKLDAKSALFGGMFELVPGLNYLPGWTAMAISCVIRSRARDATKATTKKAALAREIGDSATQEAYAAAA